ncbi:hypothetical protein Ddye_000298 [Dipteronia dyeriana]|uniref:Protein kinase domain-containing protein n=1 Tax=Dipteronia dyeriana TaxID=168575 RepID=A0AAD9XLH7_9ROSI|nr:hypothetical protein Ddye_000298 [Dipteronia dyeriana]
MGTLKLCENCSFNIMPLNFVMIVPPTAYTVDDPPSKDFNGRLLWCFRCRIHNEILYKGLAYLREGSDVRIIHRDIKSSNIHLEENLTQKIAYFRLVWCFAADMTHLSIGVAGTL